MERSSPETAVSTPPMIARAPQEGQWDDWAYQGLTILAMLALIASLWLFW
jgi:hypothetical protein